MLNKTQNPHSFTILLFYCLLGGVLYSFGLKQSELWIQNSCSILFIIFLCSIAFFNLRKENSDSAQFLWKFLAQLASLTLGIAITSHLIKLPNDYFWVQDSLITHLPESLKMTQLLKGEIQYSKELMSISGRTTHTLTGLMIAGFGLNIVATILAQLIFKIITLICIYYTAILLWNKRISALAVMIYGLCPTIFFYTLVLYKESAVQALYAIILLSSVKIFLEKKYYYLFFLCASLTLLVNERFYIAIILAPMIYGLLSLLFFKQRKKNVLFFTGSLITLFFIVYFFFNSELLSIVNKINQQRFYYSSFSDVINQLNYIIPYPLAFIKILFSPYLTFNKFNVFIGFSSILTWGSIINQLIIFASILGFIKSIRYKLYHFYLWLPFIIFLLLAAYISPWSGRLRDSFYPLIACYASFYLANFSYCKKYFSNFFNQK